MRKKLIVAATMVAGFSALVCGSGVPTGSGQPPERKDTPKKDFEGRPPAFAPGGGATRKIVTQFDKDGDGRLNRSERDAARDFLKKDGGRGRGFGPGGPGGPGGRMMPLNDIISKPLIESLDTDKDGKLTKAEVIAGVNTFFASIDAGKKGSITLDQLAEGLNRIFPMPPGFGGPGGPPPGGPGGPPPGGLPPGGPPPGGPGGFGPGFMFAGVIMQRADTDKDGRLTRVELAAFGESLFKNNDKNDDGTLNESKIGSLIASLMPFPPGGPRGPGGPGGPGGPPGMGFGKQEPAKPGPRVKPADIAPNASSGLYDPSVLRTIFLDFEDKDWEAEMADFYHTDVEIPATLTVDGKSYPNVGVHFRGMSSFFTVPAGYKRSLNVSFDFVDPNQRLYGYRTLNLLNCHDDPSFMGTALYSQIARQYIPAPKANLVRVVINGESWGIFTNVQQFDKVFIRENFKTDKGTRWKVRGGPGGGGGLEYLGENIDDYKRRFEIKSADNEKAWKALIRLCKTLNQTQPEKLEAALSPMLDIDGLLWFLAIDIGLINCDGYWIRASDYSIYLNDKGKFHIIPHDMNEAFRAPQGPGFGFGPGGPGGPGRPRERGPGGPEGPGRPDGPGRGPGITSVDVDPLSGLNDPRKPLRSKILAVPNLRAKYLDHLRTLADKSLDWKAIGPVVAQYRKLIDNHVEADTKKLYSLEAYRATTADEPGPLRGRDMPLRLFADQRRKYLMEYKGPLPGIEEARPKH